MSTVVKTKLLEKFKLDKKVIWKWKDTEHDSWCFLTTLCISLESDLHMHTGGIYTSPLNFFHTPI